MITYTRLNQVCINYHGTSQTISNKSSGYDQNLREKNLELKELKFYINNITRCLGIVVILSALRKYHQLNTLIKCYNLLQADNIQINIQAYIIQSTLQAQPNIYSLSCFPPQRHDLDLQPAPKHNNWSGSFEIILCDTHLFLYHNKGPNGWV